LSDAEAPPSRTWAEVDLGAVRHNVRTLKARAGDARLMAVVKADAYGHGAAPVARAALEGGADSLAVVTVEEAAELRDAGLGAPLLVFTDLPPDDLRRAAALNLEVTAHSPESARRIAGLRRRPPVHLKVNTGMNRWGVEPDEVGQALKVLGGDLAGVYTHLASADCDREATEGQLSLFDRVLAEHDFGGAVVHAANSAGTLWHPKARYDLVRPGVAVYGLHPKGDEGAPADEGLRPALALKSYVASVRRLEPGEGVSYGLTWRAGEETWAATVPVGYAEGYRRALSNRGFALIGGRRRPLLGRVTMDACVFGADPSVRVGDEVVLVGSQGSETVSAEAVARWAGTINYEVTTGINGRRVERSYF
jgi:alanine racemase